jgi:hypothetical protein
MDIAECSLCGQTIVQWPFEDGWNHYDTTEKPIDWPLTSEKGCYTKAVPAKEFSWRRRK